MLYRQNLKFKSQEGVVIVIALFIVALVATMSYVMMERLMRDTRQTTLIIRNTQAEFYAQGSIAWARDQVRHNWERQNPNRIIDKMPQESPVKDMNGYQIKSTIYDMQARFNINNLTDQKSQTDFLRLIKLLDPALTESQAGEIVKAIVDWITPGTTQNEYAKYYAGLREPYRPAHRAMQTISELRLIKGVTPQLYRLLQPYVTALPVATLINLQTADAPVLACLSPSLSIDTAKSIVQLRSQTPITSTQAFYNLDIVKNNNFPADKITIVGQYFLVETHVLVENQDIVIYTLLERIPKGSKATTAILWQSKGTW